MEKDRIIPRYAVFPLAAAFVINFFTYNGSRWLRPDLPYHNMTLSADEAIPLITPFILIYFLAYVQWVIGYVVIARESKDLCYTYLSGEIIAKSMAMLFFLFFPTTMLRPEITGTGWCDAIVKFTYAVDPPDNLFPSLHCLASWFCFRGALKVKKMPRWYVWGNAICTLSVFASVLLVKQHLLLDILGGIAVLEIGLLIAVKCRTGRIFMLAERKLHLKKSGRSSVER